MSTFVFLGPSLPLDEARGILDAHYLPPVRQGDVHDLVAAGLATRIAIIDGYFAQVPAVWHKELLYAVQQGVELSGASSMGALRAAELESFGMLGVGVIFQAYRDGRYPGFPNEVFEDDDEVALIHGPGEVGYRAASEAMVNIRSSLNAALASGVIDETAHDLLARCAKARFYAERGLETMLADAAGEGLGRAELGRLRAWWPVSRVDQKVLDTRALLAQLANVTAARPRVELRLNYTSAFDALVRAAPHRLQRPRVPERDVVLEELRLDPPRLRRLHTRALANLLDVDAEEGDDIARLIARRAVADVHAGREDDGTWSDAGVLLKHAHEQRLRRFVTSIPASVLDAQLCRQLEASGGYHELSVRAADKARRLAGEDSIPAVHGLHGLEILQLEEWYFGTRLGAWIPDDVQAHSDEMGFRSLSEFHRALIAEYLYCGGEERADVV